MSSPALYLELAALGVASGAFVAPTLDGSSMTFWRFTTVKHTPFAIEARNFRANGTVGFGARNVKFTVPRSGDLQWSTWAHFTLPGLAIPGVAPNFVDPATDDTAPMYVDSVGQALIRKVELQIGGATIDEHTNVSLIFWEELTGQPGKRLGEAIGRYGGSADGDTARRLASSRAQELYVPLTFSFTQHTGLALPIVSLQFHSVEIVFDLAPIADIVDGNATFASIVTLNADAVNAGEVEAADCGVALANSDLEMELESFLVYLDHDERSKFAMGSFEQVITQMQTTSLTQSGVGATAGAANNGGGRSVAKHAVHFNNVVREYIIGVRPAEYATVAAATDGRDGDPVPTANMDFRGVDPTAHGMAYGSLTYGEIDPVDYIEVLFNSQRRAEQRPGQYYRLVTPWVFHTNLPDRFLYVWSFAVDPEDCNPTGGANHSRIDNVHLDIGLNGRAVYRDGSATGTAGIEVVAPTMNIIKFAFGLAALRFGI